MHSKFKSKFSLTFDCWTADNQKEFMGITIHYINKDWKLISRLIDMELLEEPYTAEYLARVLDYVLKSIGIEDKIQSYVFIFLNFF